MRRWEKIVFVRFVPSLHLYFFYPVEVFRTELHCSAVVLTISVPMEFENLVSIPSV